MVLTFEGCWVPRKLDLGFHLLLLPLRFCCYEPSLVVEQQEIVHDSERILSLLLPFFPLLTLSFLLLLFYQSAHLRLWFLVGLIRIVPVCSSSLFGLRGNSGPLRISGNFILRGCLVFSVGSETRGYWFGQI